MAVSYRCICNLEADLYKVLAGGGEGWGSKGGWGGAFKIKGMSSRLSEYTPEQAVYSFYRCIKNSCFTLAIFFQTS